MWRHCCIEEVTTTSYAKASNVKWMQEQIMLFLVKPTLRGSGYARYYPARRDTTSRQPTGYHKPATDGISQAGNRRDIKSRQPTGYHKPATLQWRHREQLGLMYDMKSHNPLWCIGKRISILGNPLILPRCNVLWIDCGDCPVILQNTGYTVRLHCAATKHTVWQLCAATRPTIWQHCAAIRHTVWQHCVQKNSYNLLRIWRF